MYPKTLQSLSEGLGGSEYLRTALSFGSIMRVSGRVTSCRHSYLQMPGLGLYGYLPRLGSHLGTPK